MRIREPRAWVIEAAGSIEITVGCRDCGWAHVQQNVKESLVHESLDNARIKYNEHACTVPA
jgi:hypothetical protein